MKTMMTEQGLLIPKEELAQWGEVVVEEKPCQILIIVVCQQFSIEHVASNDADFDGAPFLTRWEPGP